MSPAKKSDAAGATASRSKAKKSKPKPKQKLSPKQRAVSEEELIGVVKSLCSVGLSQQFSIGYIGEDDIVQDAYMFAKEALPKWNPEKAGLKTFLRYVLYRRFLTERRRLVERTEKPCTRCPLDAYCKKNKTCSAYSDLEDCYYYKRWLMRNNSKKLLISPCPQIERQEEGFQDLVESRDQLLRILERMPEKIRIRALDAMEKGETGKLEELGAEIKGILEGGENDDN